MDFLDPKKKQAHRIRLFTGYVLIAVAIAFGTLILLFQAYGFDLDRKTGQVIQNGLVYVSSLPSGASIYLNGSQDPEKTNARLGIPGGQYTVELRRDGYRPWQRSVTLEGGSIELLTYALLVPEQLNTADNHLYSSAPSFATQSPDWRWLIIQRPASTTTFDVFDLNKPAEDPVPLVLTGGAFDGAVEDHQYVFEEWASDNRHFLLRHSYPGGSEYLLVDREDGSRTQNITAIVGQNKQVSLRDRKKDEFFVRDIAQRTLSVLTLPSRDLRLLINDVNEYVTWGDDVVLYVSRSDVPGNGLAFRLWEGGQSYLVRTLSDDATALPLLDIARYGDDWMVAVGSDKDGHVYVYTNPVAELKRAGDGEVLVPTSILRLQTPKTVEFSGNGQYVMITDGVQYGTYDTETDRRFYFDLPGVSAGAVPAKWLDSNRLAYTVNGRSATIDFDGSNLSELVPSVAGFRPYFSKDYTILFSVGPSTVVPGRYAVTQTPFRVEQP